MKLEELLSITNEHENVNIINTETNRIVSRYDGKNSINSSLNNRNVVMQYIKNNELYIAIN